MHRLSRPSVSLCAFSIVVLICSTALASGHHHRHRSRFKGSGTWMVTQPDGNGDYTVDGSVTVNSSTDLSFTGNGHVSSCKSQKTKTCCLTTISGSLQDNSGDAIGFVMAGKRCDSDTLDTIKGPMKLKGQSGTFSNLTGSGVMHGQADPTNGEGPVTVSGAVHD